MFRGLATALALGAVLFATPTAGAAEPTIKESWVTDVTATGAKLHLVVNPNGLSTTYRFEYVTEAAFQVSGFAGAAKVPASGAAPLGSGTSPVALVQPLGPPLSPLTPATAYRYRAVATNKDGTPIGPERVLATQEASINFGLPDDRGWEMVSPVDKGGGAIGPPGTIFGGGEFQAAISGEALTYSAATAFGEAAGAPPASQYVSRRTALGWVSENVSAPLASGAYGDEPDGAPYRLFSTDLSRGLLFGGLPCRGALPGCPAPNPVLTGSGAPPGYMAYYLRESSSGAFFSLLSAADLTHTSVSAEAFEVSLAAASPDLAHVVLSSCAALTANAIEVPVTPDECDPTAQNLYRRSSTGLALVNLLPGESIGTPGAEIAAPIGAISDDGSRAYWIQGANLYLREGSATKPVDESGGGATFEAASADGGVAFFTKEEAGTGDHLFRFLASTKAVTDLTPAGGVVGVLGTSSDGTRVYFQDAAGLKLWHSGTTTTIAPGASASAPSNFPPSTGTARVSPDGEHLAFLSAEELSAYDNFGKTEAYLYGPPPGGGAPQLICASCNPTGERSQGPASIPGGIPNGSTTAYRPRALSAGGNRLFFDSADVLVVGDTNSRSDVYQWEAQGVGDCNRSPGCVSLISSGRALEGASFIDASEDGTDAFFITDESLMGEDPGSIDVYDARVGGGFPEAQKPIACVADACQSLPAPPDDPTPGTLTKNSGNPALQYFSEKKKKQKPKKKKKGKKGKGKKQGGKRQGGSGR